jgi:exodeoxyribonuclease VII small subunit
MSNQKSPAKASYNEMSQQLEAIMAKFDDPNIDIEESIKFYESALKLIKKIEDYLLSAQNKIEQIDKKNE